MCQSAQQIFLAQLLRSKSGRTDYRTPKSANKIIPWAKRTRSRHNIKSIMYYSTWKFFSISSRRLSPVSAIFLSVWRNAQIIESITSFNCCIQKHVVMRYAYKCVFLFFLGALYTDPKMQIIIITFSNYIL